MIPLTLGPIRRRDGIAGQYAYQTTVTYHTPSGDQPCPVLFVSSSYGAPVVMVTSRPDGTEFQDRVGDWRRFGDALDPSWVRRFFGVGS